MKELVKVFSEAAVLVNNLTAGIDRGEMNFKEAEESIVAYVNRIGTLLVDDVVQSIADPVNENRVWVDGRKAIYKGESKVSFINRFGATVKRQRRGYRVDGETGRWYPLDEKLGLHLCSGYSPLMTYLISLFGSGEAFDPASKKLGTALGMGISATAVQRNTESVGRRLEHRPLKSIDSDRQNTSCELMVVEIDGTTSPQIQEVEGITGRESLKQPTEYKECNVVVIEKQAKGTTPNEPPQFVRQDRWTGAMYGPRILFEQYVHEAGIQMGQLNAKQVAFIADGAKHNWEIQITNFHGATPILDVYHALEHLAAFCLLLKNESRSKQRHGRWRDMMLAGDALQLIHEMI